LSLDRRVWLVCLLAGFIPAGQADDAKTAPEAAAAKTSAAKPAAAAPEADDELLEFLGSVDSDTEDEDWLDYLSQTDLVKAAKARKGAPSAAEVKKDD
jgi:hypothetical protein